VVEWNYNRTKETDVIITFQIDTADAVLSETDQTILRTILGDNDAAVEAAEATPKEEPQTTPAKKAAAKKTAPAKKAASEPVGSDTPSDLRTVAVARARELLAKNGRARVLAALEPSGAEKVSDLPDDALQAFFDKISGDEEE
jgi:hypothetical protein